MGEVWSGTNEQDSVGINETRNRGQMHFVVWCFASHKVDLYLEVFTSFAESRVGGFGKNPYSVVSFNSFQSSSKMISVTFLAPQLPAH